MQFVASKISISGVPFNHSKLNYMCMIYTFISYHNRYKEGFRKLNQTLRITHFWPPCGARNSNNNSNLSQHHTCRCPSAFVAGTSAGIMLTIWDLQRVETDWTVSVWFNFRKSSLCVFMLHRHSFFWYLMNISSQSDTHYFLQYYSVTSNVFH